MLVAGLFVAAVVASMLLLLLSFPAVISSFFFRGFSEFLCIFLLFLLSVGSKLGQISNFGICVAILKALKS